MLHKKHRVVPVVAPITRRSGGALISDFSYIPIASEAVWQE
jgi:hypothetical protein